MVWTLKMEPTNEKMELTGEQMDQMKKQMEQMKKLKKKIEMLTAGKNQLNVVIAVYCEFMACVKDEIAESRAAAFAAMREEIAASNKATFAASGVMKEEVGSADEEIVSAVTSKEEKVVSAVFKEVESPMQKDDVSRVQEGIDNFIPVCPRDSVTNSSDCALRMSSCTRQDIPQGSSDLKGSCKENECHYETECQSSLEESSAECISPEKCATNEDGCSSPVFGTDEVSNTKPSELKPEACELKTDMVMTHDEFSRDCYAQECDFAAVCESCRREVTRCVCTQVDIKVDAPVSGTDRISDPNECEPQDEASKEQQCVAVAAKGSWDQCEDIHCTDGAGCENGRCVCLETLELVCSTNGETYKDESEMKRVTCQNSRDLSVQLYSACKEIEDVEGDVPALERRKVSNCPDEQCKYGRVRDFNLEGAPFCVRTFHCPSVKESVYGIDGRMHSTTCASGLLFGRDLHLPCDLPFGQSPDSSSSSDQCLHGRQARSEGVPQTSRERINVVTEMKTRYNSEAANRTFRDSDKVWLWSITRRKGLFPKPLSSREGPCEDLKKLSEVMVRIQKTFDSELEVVHYDPLAQCFDDNG